MVVPPAPPAFYFTPLDIEKSLSEPRADVRPWPPKGSTEHPTKNKFLQNSWSCPGAYRGGGRRQKSPLDGAIDLPAKIRQHIATVSFVKALIFVFTRKPETPLDMSKWGL